MDKKDIDNAVILDIGCGYGWFEKYVLKKNIIKIIATEISENDLVTANRS